MQTRIETLKAKQAAWEAWSAQFRKPNGWTVIPADRKPPEGADMSNEERGDLELLQFHASPPDRYFLYVDEDKATATTFVGGNLGRVSFGRPYRDNFGGRRVPITLAAVNGRTYHGTYYASAGDYARVRVAKASRG